MNTEFVIKLLARIKAVPQETVDMDFWVKTSDNTNPWVSEVVRYPERFTCGTVACCAGHAVLLNIEKTREAIEEVRKYEEISFPSVAACLIGVDSEMRGYLFDKDAWPEECLDLSDKDGLIAILERALEDESFDFLWN